MTDFTLRATTSLEYDDALALVRSLLADAGFGVLTEIDIRATLRTKLDVDVAPQVILGACRPQLAHVVAHVGGDVVFERHQRAPLPLVGNQRGPVIVALRTAHDLWSHGTIAPSKVVEKAFKFLLQREPASAILTKFDCSVIRRYFPEVDAELPKMA